MRERRKLKSTTGLPVKRQSTGQVGRSLARSMDFAALVDAIRQVHQQSAATAGRAVNVALTLRNWLIGAYIHHYELHGQDRARYGEGLFSALAERLGSLGVPNCNKSRLYRYRDFFIVYPQIVAALSPQFRKLLPKDTARRTLRKVASSSPLSGQEIVNSLSYSHIELLLELDDPLRRAFYEVECMRGNWSVRELRRQVSTLYFERSGLSKDKKKAGRPGKDQGRNGGSETRYSRSLHFRVSRVEGEGRCRGIGSRGGASGEPAGLSAGTRPWFLPGSPAKKHCHWKHPRLRGPGLLPSHPQVPCPD